jgi:DNA sulfur modification protein DndC
MGNNKNKKTPERYSVFNNRSITDIHKEIQEVYKSDNRPWVIGFSGGKDSTAVLQLIWYAISELSTEERTKQVYIISTNTLIESPILLTYVYEIHNKIRESIKSQKFAIQCHPSQTSNF